MPIHIYIDADACPVREETYKVARRHKVPVTVVSNSFLRVPREPLINFIAVSDSFDAADDYIAERADDSAIIITSDILLAERGLLKDASVRLWRICARGQICRRLADRRPSPIRTARNFLKACTYLLSG